jgi:hypothetical protein
MRPLAPPLPLTMPMTTPPHLLARLSPHSATPGGRATAAQKLAPGSARRWAGLQAIAGLLACSAQGWVMAQNLGPAELAARALVSAPVQAVVQAKTQGKPGASRQDQAQAQNEAQLAAIRQAILHATLERPTRVISSAWVDDKGALHESTHFHSEAQVRGVRVMSYVQDDEPQTQVSAEVLPWGWKPSGADPKAGAACTAPPRPWRLPLLVQTLTPEGFSGPQQFASQTLLNLAQQSWSQHMQASQRWRAQALPALAAAGQASPAGQAYWRALTGQAEAPSGWAAELSLVPHAPAADSAWTGRLSWTAPEPLWRWTLSLSLGQRHSASAPLSVQWQVSQVFALSPKQMADNPSAWAQRLQGDLQKQMHAWVAQLDKHTECEPVQFHVRRQGAQQLELQAGSDSGLRPGDRVLLMNPSQVPSRMLEAGVAQHLALAEVVKVGPHRTELQALAGPALTSPGPWLALPL